MRTVLAPAPVIFRLVVAFAVLPTVGAGAQEIALSLNQGRVSLVARDASVGEVLAEWARLGDTLVLNADKLANERITLTLEQVPEARALETLLRAATGYVAAPRPAGASGASRFDRILIFVSESAPARASAAPAPNPPPMTRQVPSTSAIRPPGIQPAGTPPGLQTPQAVPPALPLAPPVPAPAPMQGNPFLRPPSPNGETPQTAPRPGIIMPSPQTPPPNRPE
jgi:hypothetical protein